MKKQRFIGWYKGKFYPFDKNSYFYMDNEIFDREEYSRCPNCGAFNEYELDGDPQEIEEVECENCGKYYDIVVSFSFNVETEGEEQ